MAKDKKKSDVTDTPVSSGMQYNIGQVLDMDGIDDSYRRSYLIAKFKEQHHTIDEWHKLIQEA